MRSSASFPDAVVQPVPQGWEDAWRAFHHPVTVGGLWVGPPWEQAPDPARAVVIDPGRAFGTGAHPTTRLCVELLATTAERGSLLDVGCGSGVLAIAGVRLGFAPVVAVDVDPVAVETTVANADANDAEVDVRLLDAEAASLPHGRPRRRQRPAAAGRGDPREAGRRRGDHVGVPRRRAPVPRGMGARRDRDARRVGGRPVSAAAMIERDARDPEALRRDGRRRGARAGAPGCRGCRGAVRRRGARARRRRSPARPRARRRGCTTRDDGARTARGDVLVCRPACRSGRRAGARRGVRRGSRLRGAGLGGGSPPHLRHASRRGCGRLRVRERPRRRPAGRDAVRRVRSLGRPGIRRTMERAPGEQRVVPPGRSPRARGAGSRRAGGRLHAPRRAAPPRLVPRRAGGGRAPRGVPAADPHDEGEPRVRPRPGGGTRRPWIVVAGAARALRRRQPGGAAAERRPARTDAPRPRPLGRALRSAPTCLAIWAAAASGELVGYVTVSGAEGERLLRWEVDVDRTTS